jgi:hypothetical protein
MGVLFEKRFMRKCMLGIVALAGLYFLDDVESMKSDEISEFSNSSGIYFMSNFDNPDDVIERIRQEEKQYKWDTQNAIINAAEIGDKKAFEIVQKALLMRFCGMAYTVACDIHEKKFASQLMVDILLGNEDVRDALNEIVHIEDVYRIIFEGTGAKKHWFDVLKDAEKGDRSSFSVIKELLERRYLLDLPLVVAEDLKKGLFNEEMKIIFLKDTTVKKALERLEELQK